MLNAATIAAIVAACWAHPSGQAYLDKIERIEAAANACGNPCCHKTSLVGITDEEDESLRNYAETIERSLRERYAKPLAPVLKVLKIAPVAAKKAVTAQAAHAVIPDSATQGAETETAMAQRRKRDMAMVMMMAMMDA